MKYVETDGIYHPDAETVRGTVLVIDDGIIRDIRDTPPSNGHALLETDGIAMPGLIDAHSHATIRPWEGNQTGQMRASETTQAVRAVANLERDLHSGVTTMRLMGEQNHLDLYLTELERQAEFASPRLLPSGVALTRTGGHGAADVTVDGPEALQEQIRENLAAGCHHVKYFATGGVSSPDGTLDQPMYSDEEVAAIIDEAHRQGVHVAAHAHGGEGVHQGIKYGLDTVEHGGLLGSDILQEIEAGGQHVVGTFSILFDENGIEKGDADNPEIMEKVAQAREAVTECWRELLDLDIDVALGTDSMHGSISSEIEHLLSFGASPETALRAVTTEAARAARVANTVGSLEPGKSADIVVVDEHPTAAPAGVAEPRHVVKRGELIPDAGTE